MMVRMIYKCEICWSEYTDKESAKECETKGSPELLPVGTIFHTNVPNEDNEKFVFAIIKQYPNEFGHHHEYTTWVCRDTPAGDNVGGKEFCGHCSWEKMYPPNKTTPAYQRMVDALKKAKIEPIDFISDEERRR